MIPGWLHVAIARGLAVAPGDRHESISALIGALRGPRPVGRGRRHAAALGLAAIVGLALGLSPLALSSVSPPALAEHPRPRPVTPALVYDGSAHAERISPVSTLAPTRRRSLRCPRPSTPTAT